MIPQQEELKMWGMTKPLTRNIITGLMALLVMGNVFFAAKWIGAEDALRKCYRDAIEQEMRHSAEKDRVRDEQNKQWYTIGELKAQIKYSKK